MRILPKTPTTKGPAEWFTGDVWFDVIIRGEAPSRVRLARRFPDNFMVHTAIWEGLDSDEPETEWGDHATDEEYVVPE